MLGLAGLSQKIPQLRLRDLALATFLAWSASGVTRETTSLASLSLASFLFVSGF